jgi:hypothetical protein
VSGANWEAHLLEITGVSVDNILRVAREAGLGQWTHNARSYELEARLLDTELNREQLALLTAVCLSRMLPRPPGGQE